MRFRFDDFEVDGTAYTLLAEGEPIAVQPQAVDLLVLLLENRDRYLAKEELFSLIWGDRAVGDGTLSNCVYLARRALGDDSRRQRYIQTLYGKGFRFSPEVDVFEEGSAVDEEAGVADGSSGRPGDHPVVDGRRTGFRPLALAGVGAFLVLLLVGWLQWKGGSAERAGATTPILPAPASGVVAILPWAASEGGAGSELLGDALEEALERALSRVGWSVVDTRGTEEAALDAGSLEEVQERTGASLFVSWNLEPRDASDRVGLSVSVHDLGGEGPPPGIGTALELDLLPPVSGEGLGELEVAVSRLATLIVSHRAPKVGKLIPAPGFPASARAYRFYLLGRKWIAEPTCESGGLEELLDRSSGLDPGFAPAWEMAARFHYRLGGPCLFGRDHLEEAAFAVERARALDPGAPGPALLAARIRLELGDAPGAYRTLLGVRRAFPDLPSAACLESRILTHLGRVGGAKDAERSCAETRALVGEPFPEISLYLGDLETFLEGSRGSRVLRTRYSRGQALLLAGRGPEAAAELASLFRLAPGELWARLAQALLGVVEGELVEAAEVATALARTAAAVGLRDGETSYRLAQVLALAGRDEEALELLNLAVGQGFLCASCFELDPSLESLRGSSTLAAIGAEARRRSER